MAKKRKGSFFGRLIWTLLIVGFVALGAIIFLSMLPTSGVTITYAQEINFIVTTITYSTTVSLKGMALVFGGKLDNFSSLITVNGEKIETGDVTIPDFAKMDFVFNYYVFIGIVLVLLGLVLTILFFRKKKISLLGALFIIVGAVILCTDSYVFPAINKDVLGELQNVENLQILDLPSLLFGVFSGVSGIITLVHAIVMKK